MSGNAGKHGEHIGVISYDQKIGVYLPRDDAHPTTLGMFLLIFSIHCKLMLSSNLCCGMIWLFLVNVHKTWILMCILGTGSDVIDIGGLRHENEEV